MVGCTRTTVATGLPRFRNATVGYGLTPVPPSAGRLDHGPRPAGRWDLPTPGLPVYVAAFGLPICAGLPDRLVITFPWLFGCLPLPTPFIYGWLRLLRSLALPTLRPIAPFNTPTLGVTAACLTPHVHTR